MDAGSGAACTGSAAACGTRSPRGEATGRSPPSRAAKLRCAAVPTANGGRIATTRALAAGTKTAASAAAAENGVATGAIGSTCARRTRQAASAAPADNTARTT